MFKKILLITALVVVIGSLVVGAVNRTMAKNSAEESLNQGQVEQNTQHSLPAGGSTETYIQGQGNGGNGGGGNGGAQGGVHGGAQGGSQGGAYTSANGGGGKGRQQGAGGYGAGEQMTLPPATPGELSAAESDALIYMREEEKLAHDVYVTLYEKWNLSVFQNISQSEQSHTDSVKALLDRYGLTDPASSQVGVFTNPGLQALYTDLVARGSQSLAEALKVGAAIEEIDILDLQERLAQVDNADILQVFNNLLNGSASHLRAFTSTLTSQTGEVYQPQYLSQEAYQAFITGSTGFGRGGSNGQGRGSGQGGNNNGGGWRGGSQP
jgi:hypothetical protein